MEISVVKIKAGVLSSGTAAGTPLVLDEPLSFWGAFDPLTGTIIDTHHPQRGQCLSGRIVLMPETRGSGSAPGAIAEAIRRNTAPQAIVLMRSDVNLAIGSFIAATLYGRRCPVLSVKRPHYEQLSSATHITIEEDGTIEI
jgi:predicted aconitase with swiveling domain